MGLRETRRAIGKGALIACAGALAIAFAGIILLHTGWARDELRERLADELSESIAGEVTIGKLRGAPLDEVVLENVTLWDPHGGKVAHARFIAIDYEPLPLLFGRFSAESVAIRGITTWLAPLPSGELNLTAAIAPVGPAGEEGLTVALDRLSISGGELLSPDAHVRGIQALATLKVAGENIELDVASLRGVLQGDTPMGVVASGQLARDASWLAITDLFVSTSGASVFVPAAIRARGQGAFGGAFFASVTPDFVARFGPALPWPGALYSTGLFRAASSDAPIQWRLRSDNGDASMVAHGVITREPFAVTADATMAGQISGFDVKRLTAHGRYRGARLQANASATFARGTATGRATIDWTGDGARVSAAEFSAALPDLATAMPGAEVSGALTAQGRARGPLDALVGRGQIHVRNFQVSGQDLGRARANLRLEGATGRARAEISVGTRRLPYAATVTARARLGPMPVEITLPRIRLRTRDITWRGHAALLAGRDAVQVRQLRIASPAGSIDARGRVDLEASRVHAQADLSTSLRELSRAFAIGVDMTGDLRAQADVRGTLDRPVATVSIRSGRARVSGIGIDSITARGSLSPPAWTVNGTVRQSRGGTLAFTGNGNWRAGDALAQVTVDDFDVGVLSPILTEAQDTITRVAGLVDGEVTISGAIDETARGWASVRNGRVNFKSRLRPLRDLTGRAELAGGRLSLTMNARSGDGTVAVSGTGRLRGEPPTFSMDLAATELPFVAGNTRTIVDAQTHTEGEVVAGLIRAEVTVKNATVRLPGLDADRTLHGTGDLEDVILVEQARAQTNEALLAAVSAEPEHLIRAHVVAPEGITVNAVNRAGGRVATDVVATFAGGEVFFSGTLDVLSGWVALFERRYDVMRGRIVLGGEVPPNPRLDLLLAHEFPQLTLFVRVEGTLADPVVALSADSDLYTPGELLGIVLGSDPQETTVRGLESGARAAASAVISGAIESVLESRLPVDAVRIGAGDDLDDGVSYVAVGEWITDDLFVAYRRRFDADTVGFEENENEIGVEYHVFGNWLLEGSFGDEGVGAADILWVKRFD